MKKSGSVTPKPMLFASWPTYLYPRGWRQERKKEQDVGRWDTVREMWESGIVATSKLRWMRSEGLEVEEVVRRVVEVMRELWFDRSKQTNARYMRGEDN